MTPSRIPDVRKVQPNTGAVVGYFTYYEDSLLGLSEIDIEWPVADPHILYTGCCPCRHFFPVPQALFPISLPKCPGERDIRG